MPGFVSVGTCAASVEVHHLLLDEDLLDSYTRYDEVGIRFCDMVPHCDQVGMSG
jgi:hypothetical protein